MSSRWVENFYVSPSGNANDGVTPNPGVVYDGTLALAANMTSAPINVMNLDAYSVAFATPAGSTLVGSLALQVSNDQSGQETTKTSDALLKNWQTLSFWDVGAGAQAVTKAVASGAQALLLAEQACVYRWARLVFTFTSGTGLAVVRFQAKAWP